MLQMEHAALASGYVRCPNHPTRWYPGGPGIWSLPLVDVVIANESVSLVAHEYSSGRVVVLMRFADWESFYAYATDHGRKSEPGHGPNVWD